jgi:hypothetical protein
MGNYIAMLWGQVLLSAQTVEDNLKHFTQREIAQAYVAAKLYRSVGRPSGADFILNSPVTSNDFKRAIASWGADIGSLKGKTVRRPPAPVKDSEMAVVYVVGPLILCTDLFFINGIIYLLSISRKLNLLVVRHLQNRKAPTLFEAIDVILAVYQRFNLKGKTILCDGESTIGALKAKVDSNGVALRRMNMF